MEIDEEQQLLGNDAVFSTASEVDANFNANTADNASIADLAEFLKTDKILSSFIQHQKHLELDFTVLNDKRCIISTSDEMRIGSLEIASKLNDDVIIEVSEEDRFATHYMNYFAMLGKHGGDDEFNYPYVDNLCNNTDVNRRDIHGQTVMHEIARDWTTDVALFLKAKGVDIDGADNWGRTPLFVAVSGNHVDMVRWLIDNGANRNHRTMNGEGQYLIHYAAKYDALEVIKALLDDDVDPLTRDDQNRTAFSLAAELGIKRVCTFFLDLELPIVSYDDNGETPIDGIITNLPSQFIRRALNQFIKRSFIDTSQVELYLSCLGKRRWRLLQKNSPKSSLARYTAPTPLEIITDRKDYGTIDHPVIVQLIKFKRKIYGNKYFLINNALNLFFTILWTISCSIRIGNIDEPLPDRDTRNVIMGVTVAAQFVTFILMYKLYVEWKIGRENVLTAKKRRRVVIYNRKPFCHPRWSAEFTTLQKQAEATENSTFHFWNNGWIIIEILCLLLACVSTIITILWYLHEDNIISNFHYQIRLFFSAFFVLVVWIRLNRCFKYHQTFGPFVAMLEECTLASAQIGFLFLEFYLPFAVAFWVLFGRTEPEDGSDEYVTLNNLLYQLWLLTFIGDYDFGTLLLINSVTAQVLVGLFLLVVSLITLNIYIALLSEAFARVSETASQRAYMEEAMVYNNLEKIFPCLYARFERYINEHCAPLSIDKNEVLERSDDSNARSVVSNVHEIIVDLNNLMWRVVYDEGSAKKDIELLDERFHTFQDKYTEKTSKKMMNEIKQVLNDQNKGFNLVLRKTNNAFEKYLTTIKEKYLP